MLNLIVVGNLGGDPELKYTPAGKAVCNFNIAETRVWKDADGSKKEETTWFSIAVWGKQAETCNQYLKKGRKVLIRAERIASEGWINKTDGEARSKLVVTASDVVFLDSGKGGGEFNPADENQDAGNSEGSPIF